MYLVTAGLITGLGAPVNAQTVGDPDKARFQFGRVALSPAIQLSNLGRDDNVFSENEADDPAGDWTGTVGPSVEAWFRSPRIAMSGRSRFDFFYYSQLTHLRALDTDNWARVELVLNRLTPYVTGTLLNTRHQQSLEIDALARRRYDQTMVGIDWRLTQKASVGVYKLQSHIKYESDAVFRETDLATSLNHSGTGEGGVVRYVLTPLTTVALNVEQQRDRFEASTERDAVSTLVSPRIEFKPRALISGHAAVGFRSRKYRSGDRPEFRGTFASAELQYTLRLRTQFGLNVRRDLDYSYLDIDYLSAGFTALVTQRIADNWDIGGSVGRFRLTYSGYESRTLPAETYWTSGAQLGYRIGRTRIGFNVQHQQRESDGSNRYDYRRLRIGSSLNYVF